LINSSQYCVSYQDVCIAAERLRGIAHHTPIHTMHFCLDGGDITVWLKCEQFQRTGAFKFRGAYNKMASPPMNQKSQGVIAYSSGNHAQAVALSAKLLDIPSTVCMPKDAPDVKINAARSYGANIIFYDRFTESREAITQQIAVERNLTLIPTSNDPLVIAGHGTAALELMVEVPDLDLVIVPVGGGGLLASTCIVARALRPNIVVIGVQTETANHAYMSLQQNRRVAISPPETIADGICTTTLSPLAWPIIQALTDEVVLVSEQEVQKSLLFLLQRKKLVVEPTAALVVAALLTRKLQRYNQKRIGGILSGGNIASDTLRTILECAI
jgi:threo-3-hydroxy-L-aspartate ammonia-lyase